MLHVSDAAVSVLKREILHEDDPIQEEAATAVRLQTAVTSDGQQALSIQPVNGPLAGDAPTEAEVWMSSSPPRSPIPWMQPSWTLGRPRRVHSSSFESSSRAETIRSSAHVVLTASRGPAMRLIPG
jgi:hypothetical protein